MKRIFFLSLFNLTGFSIQSCKMFDALRFGMAKMSSTCIFLYIRFHCYGSVFIALLEKGTRTDRDFHYQLSTTVFLFPLLLFELCYSLRREGSSKNQSTVVAKWISRTRKSRQKMRTFRPPSLAFYPFTEVTLV